MLDIVGNIAGGASGFDEREAYIAEHRLPRSSAHTGAVFVNVAGTPPLREQAEARALAEGWGTVLDDIERRLQDDQIDDQAIWDWLPYSDGLPVEQLREHREAIRSEVEAARARFAPSGGAELGSPAGP